MVVMMIAIQALALGLLSSNLAEAQNIILTNDDGWAVAQIRAQFNAISAAGYNVFLSAPAQDQSGTGSMSTTPTPLTEPCEFNSCPTGSPAEGFNASDTRLNYVNAFPVDSIRFGIQTLAPTFFGDAKPDFVASGPNIGGNTGFSVFGSGTIGAAFEAAKEGIPSAAFSASGGTQHEAWTDLTTAPTSPSVLSAISYSSLAVKFLSALFAQPPSSAVLPPGVILNVNFPPLSDTCTSETVQWVLTRVFPAILPLDVVTCDNGGKLPDESTVVGAGCFTSVSVVDAVLEIDADRVRQADVLARLSALGFVCFSH